MLPLYNESVHQRHGQYGMEWKSTLLQPMQSARSGTHRRSPFVHVVKILLLFLLLVPLSIFLWSGIPRLLSHPDEFHDTVHAPGGNTDAQETSGGAGGRKMMTQAIPLPGAHLKHLILVAGHAVYVGRDYSEANKESSWFLEDYQQVPGEAASFLEHIELGIREAARDPEAMLLFSGGQTRLAAGPRSEGLSYWVVAEAASWFNVSGVRGRTFTEEHARDSFENLLFSMCRFYELSGHYPDKVTVVSYTLKEERFRGLHRAALRFPASRFSFIGNDVPPEATGASAGEAKTVAAFNDDPYGCQGDLLQKKLRRDPFAVGPPHPSRCPALQGLLQHCGPGIYKGRLPWA